MKKIKIMVVCMILAFSSSKTHASGFPAVDIPGLAAGIWDNIQKMSEGIQNSELYTQLFTVIKQNFGLQQDGFNNGTANYVIRTNKAKEEIQNLEIAEQMQPIGNSCQQVAFSFSLGDLGCKADTAGQKNLRDPSRDAFIKNDDNEKKIMAKELVENIQSTFPDIFFRKEPGKESASDTEGAPIAYALNANPLLSSSEAFMSLDEDQFESMSNFLSLIVPDYSFRKSYEIFGDNEKEHSLYFSSSEAFRSVPEQSLNVILGMRASGSALAKAQGSESSNSSSKLHSLSQAIKDASSESAIYAISTGDTSTPTQLYRHRVLNLARSVELDLEKFKTSLRMEGILATKLSAMLDERIK